jgi:23S rRNA (cytidine1920-2'-O)/16S rRNA (cytidine1409-2'-O)-methyltransferase
VSAPPAKQRLDVALVGRGLVESREKAQALIIAGKVKVDGAKAAKAGQPVSADSQIEVHEAQKYVSRGGLKLEAALEGFGIGVEGRVCIDVGTSTGGFTDCLLQRGAARVHAVDTGAGQIHWKLRTDPRISLHENVNARYLSFEEIGELVDLIACDVSFISVTLLVPALAPLLRPDGDWIILVKPQFEAGRDAIEKGGIVRDPAAQQHACERVMQALAANHFSSRVMDSPILGMEGNREFLLHARRVTLPLIEP